MFLKQFVNLLLLFREVDCFGFVIKNDAHSRSNSAPAFKQTTILRRLHPSNNNNACLFAAPKDNIMSSTRSTTREKTIVIMYHKPPNVITSHSNADEISRSATSATRRTCYEDIFTMKGFISDTMGDSNTSFEEATKMKSKLHAIGRLDADTTGLLLLTNDGALVHRTTNPNAKNKDGLSTSDANPIQKTYEAVIMGYHSLPMSSRQSTLANNTNPTSNSTGDDDDYPLQTLLDRGVALSAKHGGQTKPVDALSILSNPSRSTTRVSITISEGKNRQIRRMFHAVGSGVMKLHRVSVGRLSLSGLLSDINEANRGKSDVDSDSTEGGLKEGEWRLLQEDEIHKGLDYKCRYLDNDMYEVKKRGGATNGRRHNHKRRGGNTARGVKGRR